MAEQETPKAKTAAPPAEKNEKTEEQLISVDRLLAESDAFLGCESYVLAGALHGVRKKNMTVDEAKSLIDEWLQKPVGKE